MLAAEPPAGAAHRTTTRLTESPAGAQSIYDERAACGPGVRQLCCLTDCYRYTTITRARARITSCRRQAYPPPCRLYTRTTAAIPQARRAAGGLQPGRKQLGGTLQRGRDGRRHSTRRRCGAAATFTTALRLAAFLPAAPSSCTPRAKDEEPRRPPARASTAAWAVAVRRADNLRADAFSRPKVPTPSAPRGSAARRRPFHRVQW